MKAKRPLTPINDLPEDAAGGSKKVSVAEPDARDDVEIDVEREMKSEWI